MYIDGSKFDEEIDFSEIEKKVKYINENRQFCEETIRELNTLIDIDYIIMSEFIEGNTLEEFSYIDIDANTKILRGYKSFIMDMPEDREERLKFLKEKRHDPDNGTLIIMKKGDAGKCACKTYYCKVPKHFSALEFALSRARQDKKIYQVTGQMPKIDKKFIEEINRRFFEKTEHKDEPGYGTFRRIYFKDGEFVVPDVMLADIPIKLVRCELVDEEMESLLNWYNNSKIHPILKATIFEAKFIKIHPFCDGNGRTARILMNNMLVRNGYPTITVSDKDKQVYFDALNRANIENNFTDLINLIMKCINERCDKYIQIIKEQKSDYEEKEQDV